MNALYELIIGIAKYLYLNNETRSLDELADIINLTSKKSQNKGGRGMAKIVSSAHLYTTNNNRQNDANSIHKRFTDKNGNPLP